MDTKGKKRTKGLNQTEQKMGVFENFHAALFVFPLFSMFSLLCSFLVIQSGNTVIKGPAPLISEPSISIKHTKPGNEWLSDFLVQQALF